jgi:hypothetical protein
MVPVFWVSDVVDRALSRKSPPARSPEAERKRRSRKHKAGDHGLCIPGRCPAVTPDVTVEERDESVPEQRIELGPAGQRLWQETTSAGQLPALQSVLLLEACRIVDRLDRLDVQLREGGEWLRVEQPDGGDAVVMVDRALSEARQQATALKALVAELAKNSRTANPTPAKGASGGIADLSARIAARRNSPAG